MVGWIPPLLRDRFDRLPEFKERVKKSHEFGPEDVAFVLQYDAQCADLRPWMWPGKGAVKVKPENLDPLRLTHYFKGPCCYCAWLEGHLFSEAKMGIALFVTQPGKPDCLGQYVAFCARQKCGYIVYLDIFYAHDALLTKEYHAREKPLKTLDPFCFFTDDTEETAKKAGLRQFQVLHDDSSNALRGSRLLLRREDPRKFAEMEDSIEKLLKDGLPGGDFWDLFTQCMSCNYVMPRHHFPYSHRCVTAVVEGNTVHAPRPYRQRIINKSSAKDQHPNIGSLKGPSGRSTASTSKGDPSPSIRSGDRSLLNVVDALFGPLDAESD
ncbi:hypothetical protein NMY22_g15271 [Coprinellus aureogranulatus]|nr:hypothetical protein NMY22_g15271 [Coprinellus aureogranulatus]